MYLRTVEASFSRILAASDTVWWWGKVLIIAAILPDSGHVVNCPFPLLRHPTDSLR